MSIFKAAIIDDGASAELFKNVRCVTVDEKFQIHEDVSFTSVFNHSSTCISIIEKYTDISDIEWLNINVINSNHRGNVGSFVKALEYCRNNNVKLIHLSIGSRNFNDFESIKKEVDLLLRNNTVIVASLSNGNEYTLPACLEGVIGVKHSEQLRDNEIYYIEASKEKINFLASSRHLLKRNGILDYCGVSNSYATPSVTAAVIDVLKKDPELDAYAVIDVLKKRSKDFCIYSDQAIIQNKSEDTLETPIILVWLKDNRKQNKLINDLKRLFIQSGYNAFCEDENIYEEKLLEHLLFIQEFYRSDIIVLGHTNEKMLKEFQSYDVIVSDCCSNEFRLADADTKYINISDMNSINIFHDILKQFEEGEDQ